MAKLLTPPQAVAFLTASVATTLVGGSLEMRFGNVRVSENTALSCVSVTHADFAVSDEFYEDRVAFATAYGLI